LGSLGAAQWRATKRIATAFKKKKFHHEATKTTKTTKEDPEVAPEQPLTWRSSLRVLRFFVVSFS
jgi:hypothetical protein